MTDVAVGFLLQNLREILLYNADLIGGVEENVKDLCEDLGTLRGFIKQYAKQHNNEIMKAIVKQIRNVVNEAEDAIETFLVQASIQENRTFFKKAFHVFDHPLKLRRVAKQIEVVRGKVKEIYENKAKFGFEVLQLQIHEEDSNIGSDQERKSSPAVEEDNVVGFDDEAKKVIDLLTTEAVPELQVISIVGMPGLGKTTLAKKILHDPKVEYEFNARAFIYISQNYQKREVFLHILGVLAQLTSEVYLMSDDMLAEAIRMHLMARRYLFIMDDVWTRDAWDEIKIAFPNNNMSSRLLITSRNRSVALHANPFIMPHDLKFLSTDYSRKLLRKKVFGDQSFPTELEEYEAVILQKCGGVPQALVTTAGILVNNRTRTYWWKKVSESVNDYSSGDGDQSNNVISLSYNHLPFHLKSCFLYFGIFREDYEIPVWKLIRLWISEGFVQSETSEVSLEDIAEGYLEELVDRDLVMVGERSSDGKIKTCRVRSTIRDFCKKEALEEDLFQEIRRVDSYGDSDTILNNYRRLCVNSNFLEYIQSRPSGGHVRSLLSFAKDEIESDPEIISSITEAFRLLRVLEIKSISFTSFPSELCDLVLVKYLCLSGKFDVIPEEVSNLWNLQTLIVQTSAETVQVQADIWKMLHLRHFHINASANLVRSPSGVRANLQTVSTISPQSCKKEVFDKTRYLKKLGVRGKLALLLEGNEECSLFESLYKLEFLENLKLFNDDPYSKLHVLPHQNIFPTKLTKLTLSNTKLHWKFMSTLGKLENLEVLKLKENAFQGDWWETEDGGFQRLKVLVIGRTDLLIWKASAHDFPILRTLVLRNCSKLETIPAGLAEIPSFQKIEMFYASPSAVSSARKIQILKLQLQAIEGNKGSSFKLFIYPPDQ